MTIVLARHDADRKSYVFEVPQGMIVQKGDILCVETIRGPQVAQAMCNMSTGNYNEEILEHMGAYLPLKKVIASANCQIQRYIHNNTINGIISSVENEKTSDGLPF